MIFALNQANNYGYNPLIISGINGGGLTDRDIQRDVRQWRFTLRMGRKPLVGEMGCALSHIKIYKKMVDENIPCACIMEDDVMVLEHFNEQLEALEKWFKTDTPQVVLINRGQKSAMGNTPAIRISGDDSACSYCINLAAAKSLLKGNYPVRTVADDWSLWSKFKVIELYSSNLKVCWHNNAATGFTSSVINMSGVEKNQTYYRAAHLYNVFTRKALKAVGRVVDYIFR